MYLGSSSQGCSAQQEEIPSGNPTGGICWCSLQQTSGSDEATSPGDVTPSALLRNVFEQHFSAHVLPTQNRAPAPPGRAAELVFFLSLSLCWEYKGCEAKQPCPEGSLCCLPCSVEGRWRGWKCSWVTLANSKTKTAHLQGQI